MQVFSRFFDTNRYTGGRNDEKGILGNYSNTTRWVK